MMSASKSVARRTQRNLVKVVRSRKSALLAAAAISALGSAASFGQLYWDTNGVTKQGAGTWRMQNTSTTSNTWSGKLTITAGTVLFNSNTNMFNPTGSFVSDQITLNGATATLGNSAGIGAAGTASNRGITI